MTLTPKSIAVLSFIFHLYIKYELSKLLHFNSRCQYNLAYDFDHDHDLLTLKSTIVVFLFLSSIHVRSIKFDSILKSI